MFFNLFSDSVGYRGVAIIGTLGALAAAIGWLRGIPEQAPLARISIPLTLTLSLFFNIASLMVEWSTVALGLSGAFLAVGIALAASLNRAVDTLLAITVVACGTASIGAAITISEYSDTRRAIIALLIAGVSFATAGVAILHRRPVIGGLSLAGLGLASAILAADFYAAESDSLRTSDWIIGPSMILLSLSLLVAGYAIWRRSMRWTAAAFIVISPALTGIGVSLMIDTGILAGSAAVGAGLALSCVGLAVLRRSALGGGLATILLGGSCLIGAVAFFQEGSPVQGFAVIGVGISIVGLGLVVARQSGLLRAIQRWLSRLVRDPAQRSVDASKLN
jgi:hypothetical protein